MSKEQFTSEEDLFEDTIVAPGEEIPEEDLPDSAAPEDTPPAEDPPEDPPAEDPPADAPDLADVELTGVEMFLSDYGVKGGMIEFDEGGAKHFNELTSDEQKNVLSSLTKDSLPSVEQIYNLEDGEIELLNEYRKSDTGNIKDFLNNIVDHRLTGIMNDEKYASIDYDELDRDDVYIYHLKDTNPDMTDEQIADELLKAKELTTYDTTTDAIRKGLKSEQDTYVRTVNENEAKEFNTEIEGQRQQVVDTVFNINDIAGASVTDEMKNFLLTDIMELNENKDPILMEKIFSSPETMFKTNWFLNYGEDYISSLNTYWKGEVSKARKAGYSESINKMPGSPTIGSSAIPQQVIKHTPESMAEAGDIMSEEDLFND
ncbi:MAG: hypothetical protein DRI46_14400 [Chloroflexi bacterium]|nr:MAG: hypothetical protein DRI46_14400 [Chloroflexota bacterium]